MPYLDADWYWQPEPGYEPEKVHKGIWVPERHWNEWRGRREGLSLREVWIRQGLIPREQLEQLTRLSEEDRERHLIALGRDLGSVQRDGFFYGNFLEQLKRSPDDTTADKVVDTMIELDFASPGWHPKIGGPPLGKSPRSWKGVLDWLLKNLAKVGKFILNAADVLVATLTEELRTLSAVAVGAVPLPSLGVEFSMELFQKESAWTAVHKYLDNLHEEFARRA
jgi:hypothetical protein